MSIQQTLTTSFKLGMVQAEQDLATDTLYLALYTAASDIGPNTLVYTTDNEVVGTGYTAGGEVLTGVTIAASTNGVVYINFDNVVWSPAAFTCRGALIYNSTKTNKSVAVLDFGSDKTSTNTFTITMPSNTATTALLRFS